MQPDVVQHILQELTTQIDGLEQMVVMKRDGTVIAHLKQGEQALPVEQAAAELVGLADAVCRVLERGASAEAIVNGRDRFLAVYGSRTSDAVLGIVGRSSVNFGLLNSSGRNAVHKLDRPA